MKNLILALFLVMPCLRPSTATASAADADCGPVSTYWDPSANGNDQDSGHSPAEAKRSESAALAVANGPIYVMAGNKLYFWKCAFPPEDAHTPTG